MVRSAGDIVREYGGPLEFARAAAGLLAGGIRFAFAELVNAAARSRAGDSRLWSNWCDRYGVLGETAMPGRAVSEPGHLTSGETTPVTLCRVGGRFDAAWDRVVAEEIERGADAVFCDYLEADGTPRCLPDFSIHFPVDAHLPFLAVRPGLLRAEDASAESMLEVMRRCLERTERVVHVADVLAQAQAALPPASSSELPIGASMTAIIPTRDNLALLQRCIESLRKTAPAMDIVIVDHCSREPAAVAWLQQLDDPAIRIVRDDGEFNWSRLSNVGAAHARGDILFFMNNDVEVISADWADRLASRASHPRVATAGPLLLYPDDRIQHAGVVIGYGGFADHVYAGATIDQSGRSCFVSPLVTRNVAAVTGACLVTSRHRFDELNGFDERLSVAGDVDYCLRGIEAGCLNVFDGEARLYHHESQTRGPGLPLVDQALLQERINSILPNGDPWFNHNLSLSSRYPVVDLF